MESLSSESLESSLKRLVALDDDHLELGKQMLEASGGALYGMDLLAAGALNRSQPHDFALAVLGGERVRDLKDRDGKKMTDAYLVAKLGREFDWVPRVYERTSGYVHLSQTHLIGALRLREAVSESDRSMTINISAKDKPLPSWIYIEAVDAFRAATEILLRYVHGWAFTKANPELVKKWK